MTWLAGIPFAAQLAVVAVVLVADAGLLLGILVPSGALLGAVAAQVSGEPAHLALTIGVAAAASILGGCFGYWRGASSERPFAHARLRRIQQRVGRRLARCPEVAAAVGQCFAGARTLTPRLAARAGVPLRRLLLGVVPAALVWAGVICTGSAVLAEIAEFAATITALSPAAYAFAGVVIAGVAAAASLLWRRSVPPLPVA